MFKELYNLMIEFDCTFRQTTSLYAVMKAYIMPPVWDSFGMWSTEQTQTQLPPHTTPSRSNALRFLSTWATVTSPAFKWPAVPVCLLF